MTLAMTREELHALQDYVAATVCCITRTQPLTHKDALAFYVHARDQLEAVFGVPLPEKAPQPKLGIPNLL